MKYEHITSSEKETQQLAQELLNEHPQLSVLALHGELGSGKTCFVQGLALALDIEDPVTSPTFTVINEYTGKQALSHIDLYRMTGPEDLYPIGFEEYLEKDGITAIEWPDRAGDLLPPHTIHIYFRTGNAENERHIKIVSP
jgi:tRNA threonylcarbamoyladenosine biosynthesis protein TsaE